MAVVGAGRGPIVKEALEAAKKADKKVHAVIYKIWRANKIFFEGENVCH